MPSWYNEPFCSFCQQEKTCSGSSSPRTEEEKERDRWKVAEEQTYSILPKTEPAHRQYENTKQQFPQAIVFCRLGDSYKIFHEDAETIARDLAIVLTSRELGEKHRIPMTGVPYHSAEHYITRLIEKGYHVAVCEQIGEEENNTSMPKEVLRVVASSILTEPNPTEPIKRD